MACCACAARPAVPRPCIYLRRYLRVGSNCCAPHVRARSTSVCSLLGVARRPELQVWVLRARPIQVGRTASLLASSVSVWSHTVLAVVSAASTSLGGPSFLWSAAPLWGEPRSQTAHPADVHWTPTLGLLSAQTLPMRPQVWCQKVSATLPPACLATTLQLYVV